MGIFTRLTDIVNSNINHILDSAEDPAKMIRMMVQEMEDTLVEVRSSAARVIADRKELERNMHRLNDAQEDWYAKAELALNKGREDLANGALIERAKLAELTEDLESSRVPLDEALKKYESDIISLEAKIKEAKQKQRSLVERQQTASSQLKVRQKLYDNRIEDVMIRFAQMEKHVDDTESRVEAADIGRGNSSGKTLDEEFSDLVSQQQVASDLANLKSKMKAKGVKSKVTSTAKN